MEWLWIYDQQCIQQLMQNKDLLLYFESFLSIINKRNPTNIVGYERKVESMSNINISYKELKQLEEGSYQLLDEPTNHLDMESITALNEALKDFTGALLFTSQDHQFVQTTANRIMEITPNGLIDKECTYDEYLENDEAARKRQIVEIEEDDE